MNRPGPRYRMKMLFTKILNQHYTHIKIFHKTRKKYVIFSCILIYGYDKADTEDGIRDNLYPIFREIFPIEDEPGCHFLTYIVRHNPGWPDNSPTEYRIDLELNREYINSISESEINEMMIKVDAYKIYNSLVEEPSNHLMHHVLTK